VFSSRPGCFAADLISPITGAIFAVSKLKGASQDDASAVGESYGLPAGAKERNNLTIEGRA